MEAKGSSSSVLKGKSSNSFQISLEFRVFRKTVALSNTLIGLSQSSFYKSVLAQSHFFTDIFHKNPLLKYRDQISKPTATHIVFFLSVFIPRHWSSQGMQDTLIRAEWQCDITTQSSPDVGQPAQLHNSLQDVDNAHNGVRKSKGRGSAVAERRSKDWYLDVHMAQGPRLFPNTGILFCSPPACPGDAACPLFYPPLPDHLFQPCSSHKNLPTFSSISLGLTFARVPLGFSSKGFPALWFI